MQAFVQQIKEFALAMMDLLKSIIAKFSSLDASALADEVKDQVDDLKDRFKNSKIGGLFGRR